MNREEVLSLIQRMVANEPILLGESSSDKDSWKAYRASEDVCDAALNPTLIKLIEDNVLTLEELRALYHIFIYNCYNLKLGWGIIFDSLPNKQEPKIVQGLLRQVTRINITPSNKTWPVEDEKAVLLILEYSCLEYSWVRSSAWAALPFVSVLKDEVEKRAIEALENYDEAEYEENKYLEAEQILDVIASIGTKNSLSVLKSTMEIYKGKQWISTAAGTIGRIGGSEEEEYLIEQLEVQRNFFVKSIIAYQLTKYGTAKSIPAILDKVKKLVIKKRKIDGYFMANHWYELIDLLKFLKKHESIADVEKLFKWIVSKNLGKLAPKELEWVNENICLVL